MKATELISKLQGIVDYYGDKEVRLTVRDNYSVYGEEAEINLIFKSDGKRVVDYGGYCINGNQLTIKSSLKQNYGKKPKITFRA